MNHGVGPHWCGMLKHEAVKVNPRWINPGWLIDLCTQQWFAFKMVASLEYRAINLLICCGSKAGNLERNSSRSITFNVFAMPSTSTGVAELSPLSRVISAPWLPVVQRKHKGPTNVFWTVPSKGSQLMQLFLPVQEMAPNQSQLGHECFSSIPGILMWSNPTKRASNCWWSTSDSWEGHPKI